MKAPICYQERYELLREKKLLHTQEKMRQQGYMDADDYGTVPLPEGYSFTPIPPNGDFIGYNGWAENFEAFLENHPIYVDPLEILCGRWRDKLTSYRKVNADVPEDQRNFPGDRFSYEDLQPAIQLYNMDAGIGGDSHFCTDYRMGLELGWGGFLDKIRKYRILNSGDPETEAFYNAEERVTIAIQNWIRRHIVEIRRLLDKEKDQNLRVSLKKMLEANLNVVEKAPQTFLEACQYIAWFNIVSRMYDRDGAGCDLDQVLLPYYRRDMDCGRIDRDEARFILANLLLIDTHYYQLSGCNAAGNDLTNELSYLVLEAGRALNIACNITVRWHENIDKGFFKAAVACNFECRNGWPRYAGNPAMMEYTNNIGVDKQTALSRIAVGCGWSAVPGRELPLNDTVKINCARVFEVAYLQMMEGWNNANRDRNLELYRPSLERLHHLYRVHLKRAVSALAKCLIFHIEHLHLSIPELVMNLQMHHTIEKGKNISQCAELYTLCVDGVGLGTIADSFAAIEQRIVKERCLTWEELYDAIRNNFPDERVRLMLKSSEHYCGGNTIGDKWARTITDDLIEITRAQKLIKNMQMVPGWFSWSKTIYFGSHVGAMPNGRRAYEALSHGANPTPGFRRDGALTAMSNGIVGVQTHYGNTAPLQVEFDPRISKEDGGIEKVESLLRAHLQKGGSLININVLDKDVLMEAHKNPMSHPDLVVRVTGFTAYFCTLSPEFRQLVVDRFLEGI